MTPMQEQYNKLKKDYGDYILLFRLGDFYEAFNKDAELISNVLGITLTGRGKGEKRHPMAGIPYHALPNYLPKLLEAGLRVAIADQLGEAVPGKLVDRNITKIITPGTIIDEKSLDSAQNNYIACIFCQESGKKILTALSFCDLTTGEFKVMETTDLNVIRIELNKIAPKEIIVEKNFKSRINILYNGFYKVELPAYFEKNELEKLLLEQFKVKSLKGFGINSDIAIQSSGALLKYVTNCQKEKVTHIKSIKKYSYENYMQLDPETIRNLELIFSTEGDQTNTLLGVLNKCTTPMGKRKLRSYILNPVLDKEILEERHLGVNLFFKNRLLTGEVRERLFDIGDIERIIGRIGLNTVSPKDLAALKNSLKSVKLIAQILEQHKGNSTRVDFLVQSILKSNELDNAINIIDTALEEDPPVSIIDGGVIRAGFNIEIDELRNLRKNSRNILAGIQKRESERTKISTLKISFNQVFGYYIEITRSHLDKVPEDYIRKQTLANAERFITQELKELESQILSSEEKLLTKEQELFEQLKLNLADSIPALLQICNAIAELDIFSNFAFIARENRYTMPQISSESVLEIINGRHPVIENLVKNFTPNTTKFSKPIHILTGPNMSGKSTYIRQCALIVLMAQIGSFVPADSVKFGLFDRIFTRVGASDNLSKGESTFMVEMIETANILNNATSKSLVILDEVGRGTSTYDGVAIAWAIVENLSKKILAKTLFATHYHELIELEKKYSNILNFNVAIEEYKGEINFLHKIIAGGASRSYGIHVAKLAGMPVDVINRAEEILKMFESVDSLNNQKGKKSKPSKVSPEQLGLIS